ncbi:conserved hypothetical protein [Candidatus Methylobacter favarea]|uniref:Ribbon-helix-helix protein CopG domain-containing protein n=1 Tax=Candidatus Methylobacter favarea TaxID=2707345 RepID=A0A8S0Y977_9GAMM|nr:hypothetical protein [Candidatus Methylobacter favarea]CAA9889736.1 conserved hypothetical protein [Candidatus Methylobacter favarea]
MATTNPTTLSLRVDPMIKEGLCRLAEIEHRSFTNMVEVMVREYCKQHNVFLPEEQSFFSSESQ